MSDNPDKSQSRYDLRIGFVALAALAVTYPLFPMFLFPLGLRIFEALQPHLGREASAYVSCLLLMAPYMFALAWLSLLIGSRLGLKRTDAPE
jgi:hypothetical protein